MWFDWRDVARNRFERRMMSELEGVRMHLISGTTHEGRGSFTRHAVCGITEDVLLENIVFDNWGWLDENRRCDQCRRTLAANAIAGR